jgi:hypothetical protein
MTTRTLPTSAWDGHGSHPDEAILAQAFADVRVITASGWTVDAEAYRQRLAVLRLLAKARTEPRP